jgi:hypothetical protein
MRVISFFIGVNLLNFDFGTGYILRMAGLHEAVLN